MLTSFRSLPRLASAVAIPSPSSGCLPLVKVGTTWICSNSPHSSIRVLRSLQRPPSINTIPRPPYRFLPVGKTLVTTSICDSHTQSSILGITENMEQALKVLVVGASSGVGLQAIKELVSQGDKFEVFALVRSEERAAQAMGEDASKVKFIKGDITKEETLQPACKGMDGVICAVAARAGWRLPSNNQNTPGQVDYLGVKKLSEAAAAAKVPRFALISSIDVTRTWSAIALYLNIFSGRLLIFKFKGENALRSAYKKHEGLSYYIVRAGGLTNNEGGKSGILVAQGDRKFGLISRRDVAAVAVACVSGKCTPNSSFEIFNNKKEKTPDLSGLLNLVPDE